MPQNLVLLILLLVASVSARAEVDSACTGSPADAVTQLPTPLSEWGNIMCTPYGHVLTNRDGWIWSEPGAYSPVFVPSQMVQSNPAPLGNASYFTRLDFTQVDPDEPAAAKALAAIQEGYAPETPIRTFRLDARSSSGRALVLYFFDWGDSVNGIWCGQDGTTCRSDSTFMLLNMRPELEPPSPRDGG